MAEDSSTNLLRLECCLRFLPSGRRTESDVYTNLDDIDVGVEADRDVDEGAARDGRCASEVLRIAAEVVVVVFDKSGEPVEKGVFAADTDCPAVARIAVRGERSPCGLDAEIAAHPGAAALYIAQE